MRKVEFIYIFFFSRIQLLWTAVYTGNISCSYSLIETTELLSFVYYYTHTYYYNMAYYYYIIRYYNVLCTHLKRYYKKTRRLLRLNDAHISYLMINYHIICNQFYDEKPCCTAIGVEMFRFPQNLVGKCLMPLKFLMIKCK